MTGWPGFGRTTTDAGVLDDGGGVSVGGTQVGPVPSTAHGLSVVLVVEAGGSVVAGSVVGGAVDVVAWGSVCGTVEDGNDQGAVVGGGGVCRWWQPPP